MKAVRSLELLPMSSTNPCTGLMRLIIKHARPTRGYSVLMSVLLHVYLFRDDHFAPAGSSLVCIGENAAIEIRLGDGQVETLFNGVAVYTCDTTKQDYVGVWGSRNASRLRRVLREHGAGLVIHPEPPPRVRLRHWTTSRKGSNLATL